MHTPSLSLPILTAVSALTSAQTPLSNSTPANMSIQIFASPGCKLNGTGSVWEYQLTYNTDTTFSQVPSFQSYELSRDTTLQEQLDFSGPTAGAGAGAGALYGIRQQCTLYHETTSPDSNGNPLRAETCYGLLQGPAECARFFVKS